MNWEADLQRRLAELEAAGLRRSVRVAESRDGVTAVVDGRRVTVFCSNDYLGLSGDARLRAAVQEAAARWGIGATGSRLVTGTLTVHRELERAIADWLQVGDCLVLPSGYQCNVGLVPAIVGHGDLILSDALCHASLIDGCRLSRAEVRVYRHCDPVHAEELLAAHRPGRRSCVLVTDGVFSMDGDIAPIAELASLCERYDSWLLVDDAHGLGVLGSEGRGTCDGLTPGFLIRMGTLSKAAGGEGGFVAGPEVLIEWLRQRMRSFIFSTGLSPALAAGALAAVPLLRAADAARCDLAERAGECRRLLRAAGLPVPDSPTPIIPVIAGGNAAALDLADGLWERGYWVGAIRPPTVPEGTARLRICCSALHTQEQVAGLCRAFSEARR